MKGCLTLTQRSIAELFAMSQSLEKTNSYRNPILPGFNPDPSICFVPGKGYFISTSTFEYFPGLPIYHSTDLVTWKVSLDMLA